MKKYKYEYQWVGDDPSEWHIGGWTCGGGWCHSQGKTFYDSPEEAHAACTHDIDVSHGFGRFGHRARLVEGRYGPIKWRCRVSEV